MTARTRGISQDMRKHLRLAPDVLNAEVGPACSMTL